MLSPIFYVIFFIHMKSFFLFLFLFSQYNPVYPKYWQDYEKWQLINLENLSLKNIINKFFKKNSYLWINLRKRRSRIVYHKVKLTKFPPSQFFFRAKRKKENNEKGLLKSCHQGQNVTVLAILEGLYSKICVP